VIGRLDLPERGAGGEFKYLVPLVAIHERSSKEDLAHTDDPRVVRPCDDLQPAVTVTADREEEWMLSGKNDRGTVCHSGPKIGHGEVNVNR
jgi:hypothetical protein